MSASASLIWSVFKEPYFRQCWVLTHIRCGLFKDTVNYPEHVPHWVSGLGSCPWLFYSLVSVTTDNSMLDFWILKIVSLSWLSNLPRQSVERNTGPWKAIHPSLILGSQTNSAPAEARHGCWVCSLCNGSDRRSVSGDAALPQHESGEGNVLTGFQPRWIV